MWAVRTTFRGGEEENCGMLPTAPSAKQRAVGKKKMIYSPRNEFCMIWVIFLMPTDHVMAFLCFITDSQLVDMSAQVICVRPGRWWGVIIEKNILLLFFMFWAIWSVLKHFFFFFFFSNGKSEFSIYFFFFFF